MEKPNNTVSQAANQTRDVTLSNRTCEHYTIEEFGQKKKIRYVLEVKQLNITTLSPNSSKDRQGSMVISNFTTITYRFGLIILLSSFAQPPDRSLRPSALDLYIIFKAMPSAHRWRRAASSGFFSCKPNVKINKAYIKLWSSIALHRASSGVRWA